MSDINFRYVKFLQGTPSAYKKLARKDNDTLYFVVSPGDVTGQLYLGNVLIAGNTTSDSVVQYLSQLQDVNTEGAAANTVLGYDATTSTWIPMDPTLLISLSVMTGATERLNGDVGLVPAPKAGENNSFLKGDGTWTALTISHIKDLADTLNSLVKEKDLETVLNEINLAIADKANQKDVYTKQETDAAIAVAVTQSAHLSRKIVNSVDEIYNYAENNTDADRYIFMVPSQTTSHENHFCEYVVLYENNSYIVEKIGEWTVSLEDYVTTVMLNESLATKVDKVYFTTPVLDEDGNIVYEDDGVTPKVEQVEGSLIGPTDRNKLDALTIDSDGSITVNIEDVEGLSNWIAENRDSVEGLLSTTIEDKIDTTANAIEGLESLLQTVNSKVTDIEVALDNYLLESTYEEDIASIENDIDLLKQSSMWKSIGE